MTDTDPEKLADRLEGEADQLERHGAELEQSAKQVKEDWQRKRADQNVPGAVPPDQEQHSEEEGDEGEEQRS